MRGLVIEHMTVQLGGRSILHEVNMQAPRGQVTAIIGPNGAGKSTLMRAVLGLVPARGTVLLDGMPLPDRAEARAQVIAWVPQRSRLDADLSVDEVVAVGCYSCQEPRAPRIAAALTQVAAGSLAQRRFPSLSGGEQARVLLARALAGGARCLLVDEPGAHLDLAHRLALYSLLRSLAGNGASVVCILHELNDVNRLADHCVLMHAGRVVTAGPPAAVISDHELRPVFGIGMRTGMAPLFDLVETST